MGRSLRMVRGLLLLSLIGGLPSLSLGDEDGWIELIGANSLEAWKKPHGQWQFVGDAHLKSDNPRRLEGDPGSSAILNGPIGRTNNLLSKQDFGDIELHAEFLVPEKSNSGIKFQGLYEIQIADSWGVKSPTASDCGGIYPRAELLPRYHHIDDGTPPRLNATRPPGEWQTLDVIFQAPRFDSEGKKIANAKFVKVVLNGQVIHEDHELKWPTGHAWTKPEIPKGPLLLQGDHGPVAFRHLRVRPWSAESAK